MKLDLARLAAAVERYRDSASVAESTRKNYGYDWRSFIAWCESVNRTCCPATPETVALYLIDMLDRGKKISTAARHASAINFHHHEERVPSPTEGGIVRDLLEGAQRILCQHPKQKRALTVETLRSMCAVMGENTCEVRDRSILTLGFASALRRSTIVALDVGDVEQVEKGLVIHVRKEKQDQQGRGRYIGIVPGKFPETCPIDAYRVWMELRGSTPGPVYSRICNGKVFPERLAAPAIARIVKRAIERIGLDAVPYAGHSLRSGFVTAAVDNGVNEFVIMSQTGHRSLNTLRRYYRGIDLFRRNPSGMIGL